MKSPRISPSSAGSLKAVLAPQNKDLDDYEFVAPFVSLICFESKKLKMASIGSISLLMFKYLLYGVQLEYLGIIISSFIFITFKF